MNNSNDTVVEVIQPQASVAKKEQPIKWLIGLAIVAIALITYSVLAYIHQNNQPLSSGQGVNKVTLPSTRPLLPATAATPLPQLAADLDGSLVNLGKENLHPLAVMIENHPQARPQSGLGQANLVYEAIAEGGITRFMAVFRDPTQVVRVGPVRSARTYFVDFATELNAFFAHAGGNNDALVQIAQTGVLDIDGLGNINAGFNRDFSRPVDYEHTLYSSTEKLWDFAVNTRGWSKTGNFASWSFQDDISPDKRPTSQKISVSVSDPLYDVVWDYDPTQNRYLRTMAGTPHKDANTGQQISAKTIILETVNRRPTVTAIGEQGWIYTLTGSGPATVIENGTTITGTWKKQGTDRTRYYDISGKEISLVRGTIWVHIIHPDSRVTIS